MTRQLSQAGMRELLSGPGEFAFLDVREQGVHARGHPFHACSAPLSHLETMVADLVPRRTVPVVLFDNGDEGLADRAAGRLADVGYADLSVLEGGCTGWEASGGELFSGVNVPSKAFGEYIEHRFQTPAIGPEELKAMLDRGEPVVVLDSRPYDEYHRMTIPRSIDVPGAELVYRVHDLLPDTDPLVVVNCAGRTRSIIGCQSLRNAGIPYRVAALTNGTMGWEIAGLGCERGATRVAVPPSERGYAMAVAAADRIAKRFGVEFVGGEIVRAWQHDTARTLFLLDVRTREEFEAGRIAGSRHAPGGQLVQATDEYIGVRNARIVLIDSAGVRSVLTASWLNQMGLKDVYVLKPEGDDGFAGWAPERGQRRPARLGFSRWPTLQAGELERMLGRDEAAVIDLSSSLSFRNGHVPGAWWGVRSRLEEAYATLPAAKRLVLTSPDGVLAHYAAPEAAELWQSSTIRVLEGGNSGWLDAGLPFETGTDRSTTKLDDIWYRPYQRAEDYERHARDYLAWEVALLEQIKRDPTVAFRDYS